LPQLVVAVCLHVPDPEQNDADCSVVPVHDTARPQETVVAPCVQPLAPLHVPVLPHGAAAAHCPVGAAVPAASAVQVPGVVPLHVWQVPQAVLPQQTPLTQLPLMHWFPAVHARPAALRAQLRLGAVPWQVNGATQCESIAQLLRQASPVQVYGEQPDAVGARQPPVPLQCEIGVKVEPVHDCVPQDVLVAASWQAPAPLHAPVLPQGGLGVQRPIVSGLPTATFVQLPALVPTLHAWHSAQALLLQQTPSTQ
jgi:hypothetical protein